MGDADPDATVFVDGRASPPSEIDRAPARPPIRTTIADVRAFARRFGLDVVAVNLAARSVRLRGTVAA